MQPQADVLQQRFVRSNLQLSLRLPRRRHPRFRLSHRSELRRCQGPIHFPGGTGVPKENVSNLDCHTRVMTNKFR